jgi:hypothetical protein
LAVSVVYTGLSLVLWSKIWLHHPTSTTTCGCGDTSLFTWFLEWPAYALTHGLDPFFSTAVGHPVGVNLPANTSELAIGVLLAPITWLFGPVATLNVALLLSPVLSALAMFALVRRWVQWTPAAFFAGLFYGFSPFVVVALSDAHLMLGMAAIPPLVVLCLDELLIRQQRSPVVTGMVLGGLVTVQFFVGSELLVLTVVCSAVGIGIVALYGAWRRPEQFRRHLGPAAVGLGVGMATAGVVLAYPVWFALAGPAHLSGIIWPGIKGNYAGIDLKSLILTPPPVVGLFSQAANHRLGGYQGPVLSSQYFGLGVVVVVVVGCLIFRRDRRLWLFAAVTAVALVLSVGARNGIWTPWRPFAHAPLLENIVPSRFVLVAYLCVAVMVGLIVDHVRSAIDGRRPVVPTEPPATGDPPARARTPRVAGAVVATMVGAVALVPVATYLARTTPMTVEPVSLPTWFQRMAPHLPPHQTLLVLPAPFTIIESSLTWQAVDGMAFSMAGQSGPGGIVQRAGAAARGQQVLADATVYLDVTKPRPAVTDEDLAAVRRALRIWGVTTVVIPDQPDLPTYDQIQSVPYAAALVSAATGRRPVYQSQAWVWTGLDGDGGQASPSVASSLPTAAGLARCLASSGVVDGAHPSQSSVAAVSRCAVAVG